jgi:hypothetical protein
MGTPKAITGRRGQHMSIVFAREDQSGFAFLETEILGGSIKNFGVAPHGDLASPGESHTDSLGYRMSDDTLFEVQSLDH